MAMITTLLMILLCAYLLATMPVFILATVRGMRKRREERRVPVHEVRDLVMKLDLKPLIDEIQAEGIQTRAFVKRMVEPLQKDIGSAMGVTEAVGKAMSDIKNAAVTLAAKPTKEQTMEEYIQSLSYARDKYATSEAQKKAMNSIISSIRKSYGNTRA